MLGDHQLVRTGLHFAWVSLSWLAASACSGSGVCEGAAVAPPAVADDSGTLRCEQGKYLHSDWLGSPGGALPPEQMGSLRCYDTCESDRDCHAPCLPHCSVQGLLSGGDFSCNATVRICRAKAENDCAGRAPSLTGRVSREVREGRGPRVATPVSPPLRRALRAYSLCWVKS